MPTYLKSRVACPAQSLLVWTFLEQMYVGWLSKYPILMECTAITVELPATDGGASNARTKHTIPSRLNVSQRDECGPRNYTIAQAH
ncbi:hypothetical protein PGTUg99_012420 [Puccinia graminis f. sp. tritici]|uniref:Uncharacterized protein n=1 Tax=Puccinia graminis f. sp. tritici TaxID=56615 RepID=A0A5B0RQH4_PUCGR|nr:hypothetical protein PGTUg99_012420 [Puccinia graminis f. sp. tritici]